MSRTTQPAIRLTLPATSANLGPGFDAAGLALSMHLTVEAHLAAAFAVDATGRDADLCAALDNNLILDTYRDILTRHNHPILPLHLKLHNEIPLGMGCGSSAAALLAGVALADHFGSLALGDHGILAEANRLEGHPDNVAACWLGGFTVSGEDSGEVLTATFPGDPTWQILLALQPTSLATKKARALLPDTYSKADAVFNVQRASLLVAAFAQNRLDLLRTAMQDRIHQPYRAEACPLLKQLLPLAAEPELAGIALSGAGPSVLIFLAEDTTPLAAETRLRAILDPAVEILSLRIAPGATTAIL
ncbi:homoserine kinase [Granulicella sp. 5B5]|uniref:homoserine kinase n=1 Tax=Granulicella sp. 5B5 TaxID=1617967 RepID=UPI0015F70703|nr:homoserine kinase [Granulicella sp. 5B5]QMV17419.1 homoserine kinase [Granulicella sp. 5B5]